MCIKQFKYTYFDKSKMNIYPDRTWYRARTDKMKKMDSSLTKQKKKGRKELTNISSVLHSQTVVENQKAGSRALKLTDKTIFYWSKRPACGPKQPSSGYWFAVAHCRKHALTLCLVVTSGAIYIVPWYPSLKVSMGPQSRRQLTHNIQYVRTMMTFCFVYRPFCKAVSEVQHCCDRNKVILCNVTKGSAGPRPAVAMQLLETQLKLK